MAPPTRACDSKGCSCDASFFGECAQGNPYATVLPIEPEPKKPQDLPKILNYLQPGFQICCIMADRNRPRFGQYKVKPGFLAPPVKDAPTNAPTSKPVTLSPTASPEPAPKEGTDYTTIIVGVLGTLALLALGYGIYRNRSNKPDSAGGADDIEVNAPPPPPRKYTILPPPLPPGAPAVPEGQRPPAPPEEARASEPGLAIGEWDQRELRSALSEWQRNFDALPEDQKPNLVQRWNYEERANEYLLFGDILPGQGFELGEPAPYRRELVAADFGKDPRASGIIAGARQIGMQGRTSGKRMDEIAMQIVKLVNSTYAKDQGGDVDAIREGVFNADGRCPRHRPVLLQASLQEAGIQSRYVRGKMMAGRFNAWVEIDVLGNGAYAYVLDMNNGVYGWKQNPTSARGHVAFGNAELFSVENSASDGYIMEAGTFNVVWRRRTPDALAKSLEPAFKALCEQMSAMPEHNDRAGDPTGRREIARRAATHLLGWISKPPAERDAIVTSMPAADQARFEQRKRGFAQFSQKGSDDLSKFVIPERWIREQEGLPQESLPQAPIKSPPIIKPAEAEKVCRQPDQAEQPAQAPGGAAPAEQQQPIPPVKPKDNGWLVGAVKWFSGRVEGFLKGRGAEEFLEAARRSDNVPDDYPFRLDHPYTPPEPPQSDLERTLTVLHIQSQLKGYNVILNFVGSDQLLELSENLAWHARLAGIKTGLIPDHVVDGVFRRHGIPTNTIGDIVIGSDVPGELELHVGLRVRRVKAQLSEIQSWHRESKGRVEELGDWYNKQSPNTQEFIARLLVVEVLRRRGADAIYEMSNETMSSILKTHGVNAEVRDEVWVRVSGPENEARLLLDRRIEYVAKKLAIIPELANADVRKDIATELLLNRLVFNRPHGVMLKEELAVLMKKRGIVPRVIESMRLYPDRAEEGLEISAKRELLMRQLDQMAEFDHLSQDRLSREAERYLLKWYGMSESDRLGAGEPRNDEVLPASWIRAERMAEVARGLGFDTKYPPFMIERAFDRWKEGADYETLSTVWSELSTNDKDLWKGGFVEFQIRMLTEHYYNPDGTLRTQGTVDLWRERAEETKSEARFFLEPSRRVVR
ncbi:MAG: hypothetical protein WC956_06020 [bacterium]